MANDIHTKDTVVYSALFGSYEKLLEQPISTDSQVRFICFTDNPDLRSDTWEMRHIKPRFEWDPTRSARELKIIGHPEVAAYKTSLWIDNRIRLRQLPELFIPRLLSGAELALPLHSFRESVEDEFHAVIQHGFDRPERVREQFHYMSQFAPDVLRQRPYWTAILARQHGARMEEVMRTWMFHVLRHSRRDQLAINFALHRSDVLVHAIEMDNFSSEFHEWVSLRKDPEILRDRGFSYPLGRDVRDRWSSSRSNEAWGRAKRRTKSILSRGASG